MSVVKDFALPDLGEGLTESEIVSWHVAVGDAVTLNQIIAEVETAKALVELPSPFAGTISRLYAEPGTTVAVGTPIVAFELDDPEDANEPLEPQPLGDTDEAAEAGGSGAAAGRQSVLVGYGPKIETGEHPKRRARTRGQSNPEGVSPVSAEQPATAQPSTKQPQPERPHSTPPVRKLAHDLGVDLTAVTGSGDRGLITRDDVNACAHGSTQADAADQAQSGALEASDRPRETRTPVTGVRKHTAEAMVASAFTAPHVTEFLTVDVTPTMELLDSLKAKPAFRQTRLNILTIVAKAVCIAIGRTPQVNAHWEDAAKDGSSTEIVEYSYVNLGIAAATPRGLMVPNIPDAHALGLLELADALAELTTTARAGTTTPARLRGGTITITNVGVFGVDAGTPILNPGEAAILAMGAVRRTPWQYKGEIALRQVMTLSLSFDHRMVDGEQGSHFLADVGAILAEPGTVLAMV